MLTLIFYAAFLCAFPAAVVIVFALVASLMAQATQETPKERRAREAHEARMRREQLQAALLAVKLQNVDLDTEIKRARLIGSDLRNTLTDYKVEDAHKEHTPAQEFKAQDYPDPGGINR